MPIERLVKKAKCEGHEIQKEQVLARKRNDTEIIYGLSCPVCAVTTIS
jgi:hypothetical protein